MLWAAHQLAILDATELGKGSVGRFIAPDALRRGKHWISAVTFFVIAVILVAVDNDFIADLPACDLGADSPDDPGRVGPGDVVLGLVNVEWRDGFAQAGPHAVVVDAGRHHH